jgi:dienelactone hydrolase
MKFLIPFLSLFLAVSCSSLPETLENQYLLNKFTETPDLLCLESRNSKASVGIIFYPGAFVDPHAYLQWQDKLVSLESQFKVFTVKMPANLAVLDAEKGYELLQANPDIKVWLAAGHSLGGTMAAQLISKHTNDFKGLIFIASYPANNALKTWDGAVLSVYASKDGLSTVADIELHKQDLPMAIDLNTQHTFSLPIQNKTHYFKINGGNHAQFGNYGLQAKDSVAIISTRDQQSQLIQVLSNFVANL